MKVSHELPIALLPYSSQISDYEYCLPVFLDKYPEYRNFFYKAKEEGRFIIMDNSLFEGHEHTIEDLLEKINDIKPDIFIVPDAWNDPHITLQNARRWASYYIDSIPSSTKLMAVVQAKTMSDAMIVYDKLIGLGFKHIALNHAGQFYKDLNPHQNELMSLMTGRIKFVNMLPSLKLFSRDIHHHLLGATLPNEFSFYKGEEYNFIKTIDTSNPIIYGLKHGKYPDTVLLDKPKEKLEVYFNEIINPQQLSDVLYNVKYFKTLLS